MGAAFVQLRHLLVWLRDGPRPRPLLFAFQWERNTSALHTHAFLCGVGRLEVFDPVWLRIAEKMRRAVFLLKSCWRSLDLIRKDRQRRSIFVADFCLRNRREFRSNGIAELWT